MDAKKLQRVADEAADSELELDIDLIGPLHERFVDPFDMMDAGAERAAERARAALEEDADNWRYADDTPNPAAIDRGDRVVAELRRQWAERDAIVDAANRAFDKAFVKALRKDRLK